MQKQDATNMDRHTKTSWRDTDDSSRGNRPIEVSSLRFLSAMCIALFSSFSCVADGSDQPQPTSELIELAESSDYVVVINLQEVAAVSETSYACPLLYTAIVEQAIKGSSVGAQVKFSASMLLETGTTYMVFLANAESWSPSDASEVESHSGDICEGDAFGGQIPSIKQINSEIGTLGVFEVRSLSRQEILRWPSRFREDKTYLIAQYAVIDLFTENFNILGLFEPQPDFEFLEPQNWLNWLVVRDASTLFLGESALAMDKQQFEQLLTAAKKHSARN